MREETTKAMAWAGVSPGHQLPSGQARRKDAFSERGVLPLTGAPGQTEAFLPPAPAPCLPARLGCGSRQGPPRGWASCQPPAVVPTLEGGPPRGR